MNEGASEASKSSEPQFGSSCNVEVLYSPPVWCQRQSPVLAESQLRQFLRYADSRAREVSVPSETRIGPGSSQMIVTYSPKSSPNCPPVLVTIIGTCWWTHDDCGNSAMARGCLSRGIKHVGIGYTACPQSSVSEQVEQVKTAFQIILNQLDPRSKITVCGYSSGAHLAAMLMRTFAGERRIQNFILICGLYDLRSLLWHSRNASLKLTSETVHQLSPLLHIQVPSLIRVIVMVAQIDSPIYHRQSEAFVNLLENVPGIAAKLSTICEADHYNVGECLCDEESPLTQFIFDCTTGDVKLHQL